MFELRETGDWDRDIFLGPLEQARVETGGADQWVLKRRELPGVARVNKVTSASLGHSLSVFNKHSTLKRSSFAEDAYKRRLSVWQETCINIFIHIYVFIYTYIYVYVYVKIFMYVYR